MNIYEKLNITPETDKWDIRSMIEEYIHDFFEEDDEYLRDKNIPNPLNSDRYINAMLMIQPYCEHSVIQGSDHDIIYLGIDMIKLAQAVDDEFLTNLHRSGVSYSQEHDCFIMYT